MEATNPPARFVVVENAAAAARATAEVFLTSVERAVAERGAACVALAGGSTPRATYELLASDELRERVPWEKVFFFFGDERAVPADHPDSNYKTAMDAMLTKMRVAKNCIFRMEADGSDLAAAAKSYEAAIYNHVPAGAGGVPSFDLILLGMGPDGHTASLFPGSPALDDSINLIIPAFGGPQKIRRLSFTFKLINAAREIVITATGDSKAPALQRILTSGGANPLPAARVRPSGGRLVWILDAPLAAAAGVKTN